MMKKEHPGVVNALGRKLRPGGRLILREPQGEGLTLEEMEQLAVAANLHPATVNPHKVVTMSVYDAQFIR